MSIADLGVSVNSPTPSDILRQPRGFVSINGIQVPWERFEISNTRYSAAGTFKVMIPANSLPKNAQLNYLTQQSPLTIQINAGVPSQTVPSSATPSDLPLLMLGDADDFVYEPQKTLITISGRDYISRFIESKVSQDTNLSIPPDAISGVAPGVSSSSIISQLATNRGLTPNITTTRNPVGKRLQNQVYTKNATQITEWDLMTILAREENYDIYVNGLNLFFQPKNTGTPYTITVTTPFYTTPGQIPTSNVIDISFSRNLRLAKDIIVNVSSWNVYNKITYMATASLNHTKAHSHGIKSIYNYTFPNLTQAQCQQKANNLLKQISDHEMTVHIRMPADKIVNVHTPISIKSTNTLFDQTYYIKNITREMDFNGGYIMSIEAKFQSASTTTP